jgi:hypothetical protein
MGRMKLNAESKAMSTTISVKPRHIAILDRLKKQFSLSKSETIQKLLEDAEQKLNAEK